MQIRPSSADPRNKFRDDDDDRQSRDSQEQEANVPANRHDLYRTRNRQTDGGQPRRVLNLGRPVEHSNAQYGRLMPKNIHHDKEKLYQQSLQLKQNMHNIIDQNTKLRTKIAILERQKEKLLRICDQETGIRSYATNPNGQTTSEQTILNKFKKMLRESQDEVRRLQNQQKKLKKTVKFTKISELEIENKNLIDESIRQQSYIQQLEEQRDQQAYQQNRLDELQAFAKAKMDENQSLLNTNKRISDEIINIQQMLKNQQSKAAQKQKRLLKDLDICRRRLTDSKKQLEYLNAEIGRLKQQKAKEDKMKQFQVATTVKSRPVPSSANPHKKQDNQQTEQLKKRNVELQQKLKQLEKRLQESKKQPSNIVDGSQLSPAGVPLVVQVKEGSPEKQPKESKQSKSVSKQGSDKKQPDKKQAEIQEGHILNKVKSSQSKDNPNNKTQPIIDEGDDYGNQAFDDAKQPEVKPPSPDKHAKKVSELNEYKQDFDQEEIVPSKDKPKSANKKKGSKSHASKVKKELPGISQLLTYRMKAQRYPFEQLSQDVESTNSDNFAIQHLSSMLQNSPFFLTQAQTNITLQYFFDYPAKFDINMNLDKDKLIEKLRKLIKPFELMTQQEEEIIDSRVAEMATTYAQDLEKAFQQSRNGQGTISKADLENLFQQLQLEQSYIEFIVGRLSLVSDDLESLNFYEFFRQFCQNDDMREMDEQYEQNSQSLNRGGMIQEQQLEESEESRRTKKGNDKKSKASNKRQYDME